MECCYRVAARGAGLGNSIARWSFCSVPSQPDQNVIALAEGTNKVGKKLKVQLAI